MAHAADWWPASCSCCRVSSPSWRSPSSTCCGNSIRCWPGVFLGLKAAVIALVLQTVLRIGKRALRGTGTRLLAVAAFVAIAIFGVPFPLIVLGSGVLGYLLVRMGRSGLVTGPAHAAAASGPAPVVDSRALTQAAPTPARAWRLLAIWLPLWFAPVLLCAAWLGGHHVFTQLGVFFSKMAVVTFGGAYAVLSYVAQQAVEKYAWITPGQMVDGLGLAETTPGPLIMVVQFVGFLAACQVAGGAYPLWAGVIGAMLTVWVTFVPCFLWIFLGAPYVEKLRDNAALASALAAITAAVVGVIANLALWFATHVVFARVAPNGVPEFDSVRWIPAGLTALALLVMFALRWSLARTLVACALLGAATTWIQI